MSFTDEEWEEISQEIPSTSDQFLAQYLSGRESLVKQEKQSRSDASFRESLSPIAQRACDIVERIRKHEQETIWTSRVEEDLARSSEQTIFPGMMFMMAKDRMESTQLWEIVRKMPKGCLLHAHLDAMVDFEFLLEQLMTMPGMHMSSEEPLTTDEAKEKAGLTFRYRKTKMTDGSLWEKGYKPNSFILLTKTADEFPDGGRAGFLKWLKTRCTLSLTDGREQHHGVDAIWDKFRGCFSVTATIIHYEPMFRIFLRRLMAQLKGDGVSWAELR